MSTLLKMHVRKCGQENQKFSPQTPILETTSPGPRRQATRPCLLHQDDWVQDTGNGSGGKKCGPDYRVRGSQVIKQFRRPNHLELEVIGGSTDDSRVLIERNDRNIEYSARPEPGLSECQRSTSKITAL